MSMAEFNLTPDAEESTTEQVLASIRANKESLELDLLKLIRERVDLFTEATGLYPSGVSLDIRQVRYLGDKAPRYVLNSVEVSVSL